MPSSPALSWRRAARVLSVAAPAAGNAALTIHPNAPALGFPASVTDTVSGVALTSCQDLSGFCLETPAPNPAGTLSVPDNYTPDGEAFFNVAQASPATTIVVPAARPTGLRPSALRLARSIRRAQLRGRGVAVSFTAPRDAGVARVRLLRTARSGVLATKLVALTATGRQTVHLRARNVRPGRYLIEIVVGATARSLGRPVTAPVTVTR